MPRMVASLGTESANFVRTSASVLLSLVSVISAESMVVPDSESAAPTFNQYAGGVQVEPASGSGPATQAEPAMHDAGLPPAPTQALAQSPGPAQETAKSPS